MTSILDVPFSDTVPSYVKPENERTATKNVGINITSLIYQLSASVPLKDSFPFVTKKDEQEDEVKSDYKKSGPRSEPNNDPDDENVYENTKGLIHEITDTQPVITATSAVTLITLTNS